MMAHIRYATQGEVSMENVHPFNRVWKGVQMCFCHVRPATSRGLHNIGWFCSLDSTRVFDYVLF
jgi:predicted glutamine amidotransferase